MADTTSAAPSAAKAAESGKRLIVYDFKRPDKFSLEQIRTVFIMFETFARLAATTLSSRLHGMSRVSVSSVDQMTYDEFIRSMRDSAALAILTMSPLKGQCVLGIETTVVFPILDRLFGGAGESLGLSRDLTDVEAAVMEGEIGGLVGNLRESWAQVLDMRPLLADLETNPQFAQIVPPTEMVITVDLETEIGAEKGRMRFAIPFLTIEPILPKLSAQYWYSSVRKKSPGDPAPSVGSLGIESAIFYEGVDLSLKDLGRLRKGSLVKLPGFGEGRAFLRMGGRTVLALKAKPAAKRTPAVYEVAERAPADEPPFLTPSGKDRAAEEARGVESAMKDAIRAMGDEIGASLAGMKGAIGALQLKQDELADQLAFGSKDTETVRSAQLEALARPFGFVGRADPAHLFSFLQQEHPQLIALVLSYIEPRSASSLLGGLPEESRADVSRRIALMDRISPDVLRVIERVMEMKLSVRSSEAYAETGGVGSLVEILNLAERSTEKSVVEALERRDPSLAEEIKRSMFVFEDIVVLDRKSVGAVLARTDPDALLCALKAAPENVKKHVWESLPHESAENLKRSLEKAEPVRLREVEKAQQGIVAVIREMEESGQIFIARPGEDGIVE